MAAKGIVFETLILKGVNKGGTLKPDDKGYYTVVLGILGNDSSSGEHYVDNQRVREVFSNSGQLARRAAQGLLRGENGHPDPLEYANQLAFEIRVRRIHEDKVCMHIRKVYTTEITLDGKKVTAIIGEIKPSGPYGKYLKESLDNPDENVAFSGRYYSNPRDINGKRYREIYAVGTWDYVTEPGMMGSTKYSSPQLESAGTLTLDPVMMQRALDREMNDKTAVVSLESGGVSAKMLYASHVGSAVGKRAMEW